MEQKYINQAQLVQELIRLKPQDLLERCSDLTIAELVLSLDQLLDKFGCHEKARNNTIWPFYADKQENDRIKTAYYLFEFLKLHPIIFKKATELDIVDRLSHQQQVKLVAHYSNHIESDLNFWKNK